jgi:hypothetical protein
MGINGVFNHYTQPMVPAEWLWEDIYLVQCDRKVQWQGNIQVTKAQTAASIQGR